jgi:hypothetical protein
LVVQRGTVFVVVSGVQPQAGDVEKDVTAFGIDGDVAAFATGGDTRLKLAEVMSSSSTPAALRTWEVVPEQS